MTDRTGWFTLTKNTDADGFHGYEAQTDGGPIEEGLIRLDPQQADERFPFVLRDKPVSSPKVLIGSSAKPSTAAAFDALETALGKPLQVRRIFSADVVFSDAERDLVKASLAKGEQVVISFKGINATKAQFDELAKVAGSIDAAFIIVIEHEMTQPAKGILGPRFKTKFGELEASVRTFAPKCLMGIIGMREDVLDVNRGKTRDLRNYLPDDLSTLDMLGLDAYFGGTFTQIIAPCVAFAREVGKPLGICETGKGQNEDQAGFIAEIGAVAADPPDVLQFVCWFYSDIGGGRDFRFSDSGEVAFAAILP